MRPALLLPCLLTVACAGGSITDDTGDGDVANLINGDLDTSHPSVILLEITHVDEGTSSWCTGSLIAPHTVLTAAHCFPASAGAARAWLAADRPPVEVQAARVHPAADPPHHDLAIVELATDVGGIAPLAVSAGAPVEEEAVTLVGYGLTNDGVWDAQRRSGWTTIAGVADDYLLTRRTFPGRATTDEGDSGGPALVRRAGQERIAGVTSRGTGDCRILFVDCSWTKYSRVDLDLAWLREHATEPL